MADSDIKASQYYLDINGLSKHLGSDVKYNERNYGAGLTLEDITSNNLVRSLTAGGYKNSNNRNSYYAAAGLGKRFPLSRNVSADLGVMAGGISGYGDGISPALMPTASLTIEDIMKLRLLYAMETESNPSVLMMNLGIPFK